MTVETKLKELILSRYKSIREFTQVIGMPQSSFDSILKRGVSNSSITNVVKICKALGISADELEEGRITPIGYVYPDYNPSLEIDDIVADMTAKLFNYDGLTLGGEPASEDDISSIIDATAVGVEIAKRKRKH